MGLDFEFVDSAGKHCGGFRATWFREYAPEEIHNFVFYHETQNYSPLDVKILYEMVNAYSIHEIMEDPVIEWILQHLKYAVEKEFGGELSY